MLTTFWQEIRKRTAHYSRQPAKFSCGCVKAGSLGHGGNWNGAASNHSPCQDQFSTMSGHRLCSSWDRSLGSRNFLGHPGTGWLLVCGCPFFRFSVLSLASLENRPRQRKKVGTLIFHPSILEHLFFWGDSGRKTSAPMDGAT